MRSLSLRFAFLFSMIALIAGGSLVLLGYTTQRAQNLDQTRSSLIDWLQLAAQWAEEGYAQNRFAFPDQESYVEFTAIFRNILLSNREIQAIALLSASGQQLHYVFDIRKDASARAIAGEIYRGFDVQEQQRLAQLTGPEVSTEVQDRNGKKVITGYAPIFSPEGFIAGFVIAEYAMETVQKAEIRMIAWMASLLIVGVFVAGFSGWQLGRWSTNALAKLKVAIDEILDGEGEKALIEKPHEFALVHDALRRLEEKIQEKIAEVERKADSQWVGLEKRMRYLNASMRIGQYLTPGLETMLLIKQAVEAIRDQLGLYFVGLYLLDETKQWAVLQAATGKAGRVLLERGDKVPLGDGTIGQVISRNQHHVSSDTGQGQELRHLSEMPLSRSEAVVPLRIQDRVLGALIFRSDRAGEFDDQVVDILQTIADDVAIGIENARLIESLCLEKASMERALQQQTTQTWAAFLKKHPTVGYKATEQGVVAIPRLESPAGKVNANAVQEVVHDHILEMPVMMRGKPIGVLQARKPQKNGVAQPWKEEEIRLVQDLVDRLTVALENARLYRVAQYSAERERILADITARVRASTNVDAILRTAIAQLAQALHIPKGAIQLRPVNGDKQSSEIKDE